MGNEELFQKYFQDGKLRQIPKKNKGKQELFRFFAEQFDDAKVYTEKEINEKLKNFYDDFAILRRYLVDYGYLLRDQYGKEYRKKIDLAE